MPTNIGIIGRAWRLIMGMLLFTWAVAGGPSWAFIGIYFLLSGSLGVSLIKLYRSTKED